MGQIHARLQSKPRKCLVNISDLCHKPEVKLQVGNRVAIFSVKCIH